MHILSAFKWILQNTQIFYKIRSFKNVISQIIQIRFKSHHFVKILDKKLFFKMHKFVFEKISFQLIQIDLKCLFLKCIIFELQLHLIHSLSE